VSGVVNALALPFLFLSRRENAPADVVSGGEAALVADDAPAPAPGVPNEPDRDR
jgi:hypothetical protein